MRDHMIGTRDEWQAARDELAKLDAEHAKLGQKVTEQRRQLPWVPVEKEYEFDTEDGKKTLAELFDGRSQLLAHNIMFGPDYALGACPRSFVAPYHSFLLDRTPKAESEDPAPGAKTSTATDRLGPPARDRAPSRRGRAPGRRRSGPVEAAVQPLHVREAASRRLRLWWRSERPAATTSTVPSAHIRVRGSASRATDSAPASSPARTGARRFCCSSGPTGSSSLISKDSTDLATRRS